MKIAAVSLAGLALVSTPGHAQPSGDDGRLFALLDRNRDGILDKSEIAAMMQSRPDSDKEDPQPSARRVDIFIEHLDANKDGFIDRQEMEAARRSRAGPPPDDDASESH